MTTTTQAVTHVLKQQVGDRTRWILSNGFFVDRVPRAATGGRYEIFEPGAGPGGGGAERRGIARAIRDAIKLVNQLAPPVAPLATQDIEFELGLARTVFGRLGEEVRGRLRAVADNPTQDTWDAAHGIIISTHPMLTLWQAVCKVNAAHTFTGPTHRQLGARTVRGKWKAVPTQAEIVKAIRFATH